MRQHPLFWITRSSALILICLPTLGCTGKKDFTAEDFKTISKDMPEEKVIAVLGKPSDTLEAMGTRRLFWETQGKYYSISFTDGKVVEPLVHANQQDYQLMMELMKHVKKMEK
jgi:hypothetical protein